MRRLRCVAEAGLKACLVRSGAALRAGHPECLLPPATDEVMPVVREYGRFVSRDEDPSDVSPLPGMTDSEPGGPLGAVRQRARDPDEVLVRGREARAAQRRGAASQQEFWERFEPGNGPGGGDTLKLLIGRCLGRRLRSASSPLAKGGVLRFLVARRAQ